MIGNFFLPISSFLRDERWRVSRFQHARKNRNCLFVAGKQATDFNTCVKFPWTSLVPEHAWQRDGKKKENKSRRDNTTKAYQEDAVSIHGTNSLDTQSGRANGPCYTYDSRTWRTASTARAEFISFLFHLSLVWNRFFSIWRSVWFFLSCHWNSAQIVTSLHTTIFFFRSLVFSTVCCCTQIGRGAARENGRSKSRPT